MTDERIRFPSRILSIAKNAFREAVRDRILYNLVLFVLLITASAMFLGELSAGQEARVIVNLGLSSILIFGAFVAIFVGVSLVWKEIEKRTVYSIFSKPIGRGEFIIGKYLGLCLTLLVNVVIMGAGVSLALIYVKGTQFAGAIWLSILMIYLELTILTAVAILFSSFSTPALSALLTFFVFVIGHFSASLRLLSADIGSRSAGVFFDIIYYLLPNLSHFTFATETANGMTPPLSMVGGVVAYAIVYNIILLTLTVFIFSRRNFK
jgi:ABC-type transport system involved in multi-copper enzyme maturation permease subunit